MGQMATTHVCVSVPNFLVCEWHWINHLDLWKAFIKEGQIIVDGHITVTDKPGPGVEMNEAVAKTAQISGTTWLEPNK